MTYNRPQYVVARSVRGHERGFAIQKLYGGPRVLPIVWSTGDIAKEAGVVDASVNDWVRRNSNPVPAFVSRNGLTYWSEEDARAIIQGFITRRELAEERKTLPRNERGTILWGQVHNDIRVRHGKPALNKSRNGYEPKPQSVRRQRQKVAAREGTALADDQARAERALEWLLEQQAS